MRKRERENYLRQIQEDLDARTELVVESLPPDVWEAWSSDERQRFRTGCEASGLRGMLCDALHELAQLRREVKA